MIENIDLFGILPLALLGGLLALDVVSFPQAMISRPLVAATLAGALVGQAMSGLLLGAALELIALETLPFGASRYPEWGSAAVVGGALFASHPAHPAGSMAIAALASLTTASIGGWTMVKLRTLNATWAGRRRDELDAGARDAVLGLQVRGLSADFLRGALLTAVSLAVFAPLGDALLHIWSIDARFSRAMTVGIAASVTVAAAWKLFHGVQGARWYLLAGLVVGAALTRLA